MPCSPEQRASNRRNAQRSTGPRTESGKNSSRQNAFKHGLTGEGVVISGEDSAEIDARFESFEKDLKPANDVARYLARRAAMMSVRVERCCRQEASAISKNRALAETTEANLRQLELDELIARIKLEPGSVVRRLRRIPEGIDWMISSWQDLRTNFGPEGPSRWNARHTERAENLAGRPMEGYSQSMITKLVRLFPVDGTNRHVQAATTMVEIIDQEIARLKADRAALDLEGIAASRTGAADRALFDGSREAVLARKYEAAADRDFFKAIREIERVNAQIVESDSAATNPAEETDSEELASIETPETPAISEPQAPRPQATFLPNQPPVQVDGGIKFHWPLIQE